jgi:hypothetical protein
MTDELMQLGDNGPPPKAMIVATSVFVEMKLEGLGGIERDEAKLELCEELAEYGNPELIQIDYGARTWEPIETENK